MSDKKYILECQTCGKVRTVSRTMMYQVKKGVGRNCLSCSGLGNKHRYLGEVYPKYLYNSSIYRSWYNMKTRCQNPKATGYHRYGGRGIKVCEQWLTFSGFLRDMQSSYQNGLTIERIDNNGNYEPSNCRWATKAEQARNTLNTERATRWTFNGETRTIREWAELCGLRRTTLDRRLNKYGWSIERALS